MTPVGAYLAQDDIIRIALEHGVDMIHPGYVHSDRTLKVAHLVPRYGFLSENATFAKKVEQAGLAFVGPTPEVIDSLGDKTKARAIGESKIRLAVRSSL
jgi:pyruvate carboxylase